MHDEPVDYIANLPSLFANLTVAFDNTSVHGIGDLSTSINVKELDIYNYNVAINTSNTSWPPNLESLQLRQAQFTTLPNLASMPQLLYLDVRSNLFTRLENLDLRGLRRANFDDNPITTISNVSLSSGERSDTLMFGLSGCKITTFLVNPDTYTVLLNANKTVQLHNNDLPPTIDVSATCKAPNSIKPVMQGAYSVCVTPESMLPPPPPPPPPTTAPSPTTISPLSASTSADQASSRLSSGAIAGIIVGLVTVVASLVLFLARRQRRLQLILMERNALYLDALQMLRLDEGSLVKLQFVAEGAYGQVSRGAYKGEPVAIKSLLPGKHSQADVTTFVAEIQLASMMESPYIVKLLGASWRTPSELEMVLERRRPHFYWDEKATCMLSIAEGLVYMYTMNIIHRDLKSRNILLDAIKGTKLTDFGVSREMTTETMTIGVGTYRWMAPEVLQECYYSTSADIYSFGMVLSELSTHDIPYADVRSENGHPLVDTAIMSRVIQGTISPSFVASTPMWVITLAQSCLAHAPEHRPTAIEIAHTIERQRKTLGHV
ncbi:TKL protein kinase [Saprolegnia parasitica CBS 223.65]|uniref:TKL protein kinase n=1 Tax=Saprolegnia parasitica (strain CBS 223.65) TaxID=695850 RepID=A0A067C5C6_SAPPC|nr:TKL protein kinase [Saprolegnia parasitica CBS 223.65]KDO25688.1 TKL protein kinase [Saprolegnia parasitica CBS 223.65]|eukprot:XP_012203498.1 TKL protein kinase [Saprolegnia parasitica CBS 223.65]